MDVADWLCDPDAEPDGVTVAVAVGVAAGLRERDGDADCDGVFDGVAVDVDDWVAVPLLDGVNDDVTLLVGVWDAVCDVVAVGEDVEVGDGDGDAGARATPRNCVLGAAVASGAPPLTHESDGAEKPYIAVGVTTYSVAASLPRAACVTLTSLPPTPGTYTAGRAAHVDPVSTTRRRPAPESHTNIHEALKNVKPRGAFIVAPTPSAVHVDVAVVDVVVYTSVVRNVPPVPAGKLCDVMKRAPVKGEKSTNCPPIAFSSAVSEPAGYCDVLE